MFFSWWALHSVTSNEANETAPTFRKMAYFQGHCWLLYGQPGYGAAMDQVWQTDSN
jgi:hypothetical protein